MKRLSQKEWIGVIVGLVVVTIAIIIPSFQFSIVDALFNTSRNVVLETESSGGLFVQDISIGVGKKAVSGDRLTVHYTGSLSDGTIFDSSRDNDRTFVFILGQGDVIEGWDSGLLGMREGGTRLLIIPASMGYGSVARGPIPANSPLLFEIELLKIEDQE